MSYNFSDLSDDELSNAVYEAIRRNGRVESGKLEITSHNGVICLRGFLPSEAKRRVLLGILNNIMDFPQAVDETVLKTSPPRFAGERTERKKPVGIHSEIDITEEDTGRRQPILFPCAH